MDHAEALRLIDEAALEPGGLERLMSGDTAESAALAGHVAGCEECSRELAAAQRIAHALQLVAEETPSPELRARTLALVAAVGRPRSVQAAAAGEARVEPRPSGGLPAVSVRRRFGLVALAAAAAFALLAGGSFVAADLQGQLDRTRQEAAHLRQLYREIEVLLQRPTSRLVALQSESGTAEGSLIVDPGSNRIAVLADELPPPARGMEYRCWVEIAGVRQPIGRMWFDEGLAYWAGTSEGIAAWPSGASFGVSLEPVGEPSSRPAVLFGDL